MARLINLTNEDVGPEANLEGYEAKDARGEKLGKVESVIADGESMEARYLVIDSGGLLTSKQYVVPVGEVGRIDDGDKSVLFRSLSKETLKSGSYPQYDEAWWESNDGENFGRHEQQVAQAYAPRGTTTTDTSRPIDYTGDLYKRPAKDAQRLQLMEEHLKANKERYQAGSVTLGKRVIERQESIEVPVTEERVVIERHAASGNAPAGEIGRDQTIEVPVERERVTMQKETVVTEEVGVRKEAVQHTEQVQDTVRKEELVVEDKQGLMENDGKKAAPREGDMPKRPR